MAVSTLTTYRYMSYTNYESNLRP